MRNTSLAFILLISFNLSGQKLSSSMNFIIGSESTQKMEFAYSNTKAGKEYVKYLFKVSNDETIIFDIAVESDAEIHLEKPKKPVRMRQGGGVHRTQFSSDQRVRNMYGVFTEFRRSHVQRTFENDVFVLYRKPFRAHIHAIPDIIQRNQLQHQLKRFQQFRPLLVFDVQTHVRTGIVLPG